MMLLAPALCVAQDYDCRPSVKYECTQERCDRIVSNFQHAESFTYERKTARLSACLWTNCYASKANVFVDRESGTFTAVGKLTPQAHPGNDSILVSLTIDSSSNFSAVWGYGGKDLTFDMGTCKRSK
jgi:hypothetical protein